MTLEQDYRYILEPTPLGRGIFSQTKKATIALGEHQSPPADCRDAIVKTLAPHLRALPDYWRFKRRFSKLAHRLAECQHPHLVRVIDYFEEEGQPYVVYEAIAGRSLAEILAAEGALPLERALRYLEQASGAIATLHTAGLLHLDLNPGNLILRPGCDEVVAIEFGLTAELTPEIEQTRASLLSPGYAAPEQHQPEAVCTPAADIYALSATLYALLTGSPPPPAPLLELIERDRWQTFPDDLPDCIKTAILQGLSLDPQQRPQSIEAWQCLLKGIPVPPERDNLERQALEDFSRVEVIQDAIAPEAAKSPNEFQTNGSSVIEEHPSATSEAFNVTHFSLEEEIAADFALEKTRLQAAQPTLEREIIESESGYSTDNFSPIQDRHRADGSSRINAESFAALDPLELILPSVEEVKVQDCHRADGRNLIKTNAFAALDPFEPTISTLEEVSPALTVEKVQAHDLSRDTESEIFQTEAFEPEEERQLKTACLEQNASSLTVEEVQTHNFLRESESETFQTEVFEPEEEGRLKTASLPANFEATTESENCEEAVGRTDEKSDFSSFSMLESERLPEILEISHPSTQNGRHALTLEELQTTKMVLWWLSQSNRKTSVLNPKFPMRALLVTCAIAASAGAGLGISVRVNRPEEAGSSVWHLKQSFPPRNTASPTIEEQSQTFNKTQNRTQNYV